MPSYVSSTIIWGICTCISITTCTTTSVVRSYVSVFPRLSALEQHNRAALDYGCVLAGMQVLDMQLQHTPVGVALELAHGCLDVSALATPRQEGTQALAPCPL